MIFALPLFDMIFAIVRRLWAGKSPFAPDRGHIHHRLIDMGFTQKESVKILYALCGILGLVAVVCTDTMFENYRVARSVAIVVIALVLFVINILIMKNPDTRRHSGLTEDDMTTADYIHELDPEKARKIEMHNGGVIDPAILEALEQKESGDPAAEDKKTSDDPPAPDGNEEEPDAKPRENETASR